MMDKVYIRGLLLEASIGIYEWEKRIAQKVRIDVEMAWDNKKPAASDKIEDALNYKTATQLIAQLIENQHYELVERLAEDIATTLRQELNIPWLRVTISKPGAVKNAIEVGVQIERGEAVWQAST